MWWIILLNIGLLILLITRFKVNAFLSFLLIAMLAGTMLGVPGPAIIGAVEKGIGDMLGSLIIVVVTGAMLGKLAADSGAAQQIARGLMGAFGPKYIQWALMVTGFIIGIPLFYNVGFVLVIPLIFTVAYKYKIPAVYVGLPMLSSLSVTHGFLPPHPSPVGLVAQFNADMGRTLAYGILIAIPTVIIAGPLFSRTIKDIKAKPLDTFIQEEPVKRMPGLFISIFSSLLPVLMLVLTTAFRELGISDDSNSFFLFLSNPSVVLIISLLVATFTLGINMGMSMTKVMGIYAESVKDISMLLLIMGGAGALKQVLVESGVSAEIGTSLQTLHIHPLILGWLIACAIRLCVGSATVAGLTAAGIIAPLLPAMSVDPSLMVLAIGAGSLMFSHVNDAGFWLFKEYFNLSIRDTIRSWSIMETIVAVVGLIGVLGIHYAMLLS